MVIHWTEREIPSVLADSHWLTAFSDCKMRNSLSQHCSLRPELSPDLGLRRWPPIGKNIKRRHDIGLHPVLAILTSFETDIAYFIYFNQSFNRFWTYTSGRLRLNFSLRPVNHHHLTSSFQGFCLPFRRYYFKEQLLCGYRAEPYP